MTEPYYQDDLVQLFNGDCLEVTEWLSADVLVTDPPYGMSYTGFDHGRAAGHPPIRGDASLAVRDSALSMWEGRPALVFGTWRVPMPNRTRQVIVWDKDTGGQGLGATDLPWASSHEEVYVCGGGFRGSRTGSVLRAATYAAGSSERPAHPTPKPVGLMEHLISKCPPGLIADPFAGSGSTLVAAKSLGRKAVGVEIEERYCEIAAKRLAQGAFDFGEAI
jgi:DNA modification methylase